ncbi:hypothetical protein MMAD_52110 [Mycolicibacterium madagascariense]|uniref:Uncharacterized protein n=1 Tax=Mycolicibacterium madagascariense TaxID=212765 RepID=A0A7I7XNX0_9MYCO|nr:hypothetical protein [Mycolicibacterium madagascariense]MCV7012008.1 hypothetical protein [Mycolicibacterium madagascariense]BBZ30916.1 hypothetical protein MMAD_52110 [Mycolicibacterium madagascariense]
MAPIPPRPFPVPVDVDGPPGAGAPVVVVGVVVGGVLGDVVRGVVVGSWLVVALVGGWLDVALDGDPSSPVATGVVCDGVLVFVAEDLLGETVDRVVTELWDTVAVVGDAVLRGVEACAVAGAPAPPSGCPACPAPVSAECPGSGSAKARAAPVPPMIRPDMTMQVAAAMRICVAMRTTPHRATEAASVAPALRRHPSGAILAQGGAIVCWSAEPTSFGRGGTGCRRDRH